jgi:hypothetical protein
LEEEKKVGEIELLLHPFYVTVRHGLVYRIKKVEILSMHMLEKK